jgi:hypothetical protein
VALLLAGTGAGEGEGCAPPHAYSCRCFEGESDLLWSWIACGALCAERELDRGRCDVGGRSSSACVAACRPCGLADAGSLMVNLDADC